MKLILAFTLASLLVAALSQRLLAQAAFGAKLTHTASNGSKASVPASRLVSSLAPPDRERAASIPLDQIGATAEKQYSGDGLSVCANEGGARLRCVFQKLDGDITSEGLGLSSTAQPSQGERFRVKASAVGRVTPCAPFENLTANFGFGAQGTARPTTQLTEAGIVKVADKTVRFIRPGLIEEYSVSMDGVRQDFVVLEKPAINLQLSPLNSHELRVELSVSGARVE